MKLLFKTFALFVWNRSTKNAIALRKAIAAVAPKRKVKAVTV